ncbi:MAG: hypothetical protein HQK77_13055 [Desulfobacterales bacterium]|nr:hypothetical protein [Desulfobacterales bacterium]
MDDQYWRNEWVYVLVQNPGNREQYVGIWDDQQQSNYIPCFLEKDHAENAITVLPLDKQQIYEAQAVRVDMLSQDTSSQGFIMALLDAHGHLLNIIPNQSSI